MADDSLDASNEEWILGSFFVACSLFVSEESCCDGLGFLWITSWCTGSYTVLHELDVGKYSYH